MQAPRTARSRLRPPRSAKPDRSEECSCVARTLKALKCYDVRPEQIDDIILQAINISLCLESDGDARVAEGFNNDIVINGRSFGRR
ncbi:MAG TPA: hypothetical protein VN766_18035 [Stellaceae bacterium]|jgi:hypothetical protein|nr:hypothetical protein [Stellaceae bacterium]